MADDFEIGEGEELVVDDPDDDAFDEVYEQGLTAGYESGFKRCFELIEPAGMLIGLSSEQINRLRNELAK